MEKYIKVYMDYFGYQIKEDIICEMSNDGTIADNIHHINGRGKGKDVIENLIAVTFEIHDRIHFRGSCITKENLSSIHAEFMAKNKR